jgi:outer membrane protein TolC
MTLEQYLMEVQKKHKEFQSLNVSKEAAEDRRVSGDLELAPVFTMAAGYLSDAKQPQATGGTKLVSSQYSAGLAKEFSTGTALAVNANVQKVKVENAPAIFPPDTFDYSAGSLGFSLEQSLWKNSFGNATRLRHQREYAAESLEKESYNLQQRQILIGAESAYWDYLYQQEELRQRTESLERARKIESWLKRRYADGINDKADYLNAQALSASRELALATTRDAAAAAEKTLRDYLEMDDKDKTPTLQSDFKQARNIANLIEGERGQVVRLDSYLASLEAKTKSLAAREVKDALRPDLVLQGQYNTNSNVQNSPSNALNKINNTDIPTSQIGLKFTYLFDTDSKVSKEALARKEALAAQLASERKSLEGESSWSELQRHYAELLKQIDTADRISKLQLQKAKEQALKLSRGRAVTTDVVNSEEDASSSQLILNRLLSEARKLEAQSRLFIRIDQSQQDQKQN